LNYINHFLNDGSLCALFEIDLKPQTTDLLFCFQYPTKMLKYINKESNFEWNKDSVTHTVEVISDNVLLITTSCITTFTEESTYGYECYECKY
jgi:hypothetical protein